MLPEVGGGDAGVGAFAVEGDGRRDLQQLALRRVLHVLEEAGLDEVGVVEEVVDPGVGTGRDARPVQLGDPLVGRASAQAVGDEAVERLEVLGARPQRRVAVVVGELGPPDDREELPPVLVRVDDDRDPAVGRLVRTALGCRHTRVAGLAARRDERPAPEVLEQAERDEGLEHRDLDRAALAGRGPFVERSRDRERGGQARDLVGDRGGDVRRLTGDPLLLARDARRALDDVVVGREVAVRATGPETADRAVDELGVAGTQRLGVRAAARRGVRTQVVHEARGGAAEALEHVASRRRSSGRGRRCACRGWR